MKEHLSKALISRLSSILSFVENQKNPYKYVDLTTKAEIEVKTLEELPCEFTLLMNDKTLISKQKNSLQTEIDLFLKSCNDSWEHFTGDHLHPVPNNISFDKDKYNPTLGYYGMKNNKSLWLKKCGECRTMYLKHIMTQLKKVNV